MTVAEGRWWYSEIVRKLVDGPARNRTYADERPDATLDEQSEHVVSRGIGR